MDQLKQEKHKKVLANLQFETLPKIYSVLALSSINKVRNQATLLRTPRTVETTRQLKSLAIVFISLWFKGKVTFLIAAKDTFYTHERKQRQE